MCKIVNDLEEKLLQAETCHSKALEKTAELESALQNAQYSLEEKNIAIMDLTTELRWAGVFFIMKT